MSESYQAKVRVNGTLLPQFNEQGVVVLGRVQNVDPNGTSLSLKASDGKMVNVIFDQPVMENLEGIVEVHGVCHGSQVRCQSYYMVPIDATENFDMETYDEAVNLIHSSNGPNPWLLN